MATYGNPERGPLSDKDPYSISGSALKPYRIDYDQLPRPLPILGPLFGINGLTLETGVREQLRRAENILQRPPTQDEANALAYCSARNVFIFSCGPPAGISVALLLAWNSRHKFAFPFYKPNMEKFNAAVFPPKIPMLLGKRAVLAWHISRALAYGVIGKWFGANMAGSYGFFFTKMAMKSDSRLKAYNEAAEQRAPRSKGEARERRMGRTIPPSTPSYSLPKQQQDDDASPTDGAYGVEGVAYSDNLPEAANTVDEYAREEERGRRPWQQKGRVQVVPRANVEASAEENGPFDMFEDASPTGGQRMPEQVKTRSSSNSNSEASGSAWGRIRRGETLKSISKAKKKEPNDGRPAHNGDSFTFSKTDEEKSYAKEEAQKDFDARIEMERMGKDFGSGHPGK